uniref:Peptidase A1 domain-containing protein n=1 Tax=Heterorhabditis bacteriophora TaxID=37862 RepID=A0A1I7XQ96_HETBA
MAFTNTSPCVFPTGSAEKSLGSNPICMAAPANNGDSFFLDMASTTVAYGKIEVVDRRGGRRIPSAWGADANGIETFDPKTVLNGGGLQPLGGSDATGGYKGTGLCMMVEVLCGIMAGSAFGKNIRQWQTTEENANLGQCFVVIDPDCFAPGFRDRLENFLDETRGLKPASTHPIVLRRNHIIPLYLPIDLDRSFSTSTSGWRSRASSYVYVRRLRWYCIQEKPTGTSESISKTAKRRNVQGKIT